MTDLAIKIVATPYEDGQTKTVIRKALKKEFPKFRVASILRDEEGERWLAQLIAQDEKLHHKVAEDDEKAPFPLKELGPDGEESDDSDSKDESDDDKDKVNTDDDELKKDEKPAEDDKDDAKGELADLVKAFKKLLPALEKVVGPISDDTEEGVDDLPVPPHPGPPPEDIGPVPGGPPTPGLPAGGPPPPGGGRPPAPVRRPGMPGGRPRPGMRPPVGVPAFSKRENMALQRTADVTEDEARQELLASFPDYEISDFTEVGGQYRVTLKLK